jgi:hypothetical protein
MSQQEFVPGQQGQSENEEEIYEPQYPYSWSGNSSNEGVPRDEPPSSYEYEAGYQAQDAYSNVSPTLDAANDYTQPALQTQQTLQTPQPYQYNQYDGDAYEQGYAPYNNSNATQNQGVPPWARPQPQGRSPFRFGSILLVLILISVLSSLGHGYFFYGGGHLIEWFFGMLFFPLFILMMILSSIRRGGRRRYRRGPWGW